VSREAFIVLMEPRQHLVYEAVVSLTADSVVSWRPVPGFALKPAGFFGHNPALDVAPGLSPHC
jgi:Cu2+-containing amine oxidase